MSDFDVAVLTFGAIGFTAWGWLKLTTLGRKAAHEGQGNLGINPALLFIVEIALIIAGVALYVFMCNT